MNKKERFTVSKNTEIRLVSDSDDKGSFYCTLCGKLVAVVTLENMRNITKDTHVCEPAASEALSQIFKILTEGDSMIDPTMNGKMMRIREIVESFMDGH